MRSSPNGRGTSTGRPMRVFLERAFGIDLRTLALFRAALGTVLLAGLAFRPANIATFYTDLGVMPRDWLVSVNGPWRFSLHAANCEPWFAGLLLALEALAALALLAGYRTRPANVVAFVLHGSLLNRNPLVLLGADPLLMCLLFWGMFLPLGARWSVDAALARKPLEKTVHLSWASAGLLLQTLSVYFFSALFKSGREWWPEGTAVWYALSIDGYVTPIGEWLRGFSPATHALTYLVYFLELLGPPLALLPFLLAAALSGFIPRAASRLYAGADALRFAVMALFALMHIGFIFCLKIGPFAFISLASLTVLAGARIWDGLGRAMRKPQPHALRIYYDRDCGFCEKSVLLMRIFLILPGAEIGPVAAAWTGFFFVAVTAGNLWESATLARLGATASVLGLVAVALAAAGLWWWAARRLPRGTTAQVSAAALVLVFLAWNLCTVRVLPGRLYAVLTPAFSLLRVDQRWDMFAPYPSKEDGWFVIPGKLADGREIDLMHPERSAVSYDKPRRMTDEWPDIRWHKYLERIWSAEYSSNRLYYGRFLCRSWNGKHPANQRLDTFRIIYMLEMSVPEGQTPSVEQRMLWEHECFAPARSGS